MSAFRNRVFRVLILVTAVGLSASAGLAQARRVRIKRQSIRVDVQGLLATTTVENVYVNDGLRGAETTYDFVLPASASVHGLAMWINNVRCPAVVYPRATARRIYRRIVQRRRDPAILEYLGEGRWHLRVFPIPVTGTQKVQIVFSHVMPVRDGRVVYEFPKVTRSSPVTALDFSAELRCPGGVKEVISQSHGLSVKRLGGGRVRASFGRQVEGRPKPIWFAFVPNAKPPRLVGPAGKDGRADFLASVPWPDLLGGRKISRNVVFVLDTSGSMTDRATRWLQTAVERTLKALGDADRFAIISAGADAMPWRGGELVRADAAAVKAAKKHIDALEPSGGTDLAAALRAAEACNTDKTRPLWIVVLTDGADLVGAKGVATMADLPGEARRPVRPARNVRLNWFFLSREWTPYDVAATLGGKKSYVEYDAALDPATRGLLADLARPPVEDVRLTVTAGKDVGLTDVAHSAPVAGRSVSFAGRYAKGGEVVVTVSARMDGRPCRAEARFKLPDPPKTVAESWASAAFGKIAAHWRCDWLWERLQQPDVGPEALEKLVALSRAEGIVTRATAFLILENEDAYLTRGIEPPGGKLRAPAGAVLTEAENRQIAGLKKKARALRARGKYLEAADMLAQVVDLSCREFAAGLSAAVLREFVAIRESNRADRLRHAYGRGRHVGPWQDVFLPLGVMGQVPVRGDTRPIRRPPPLPTDRHRPPSATRKHLRVKLSRFEFNDAELKDVVAFFREAAAINVQVRWPALGLMGIDKSTTVNVKLKGVSFARALRAVLDELAGGGSQLDYVIDDDGVLMISTREDLSSRTVRLIYDIRDLLPVYRGGRWPMVLRERRAESRGGGGFFDDDSGSAEGGGGAFWGRTARMGDAVPSSAESGTDTEAGDSGRIVDVGDMIVRVPNFRQPRGHVWGDEGGGGWWSFDRRWPRTRSGAIALTKDLIRNLIDPTSWRTAGGEIGSIDDFYGLLIVTQTNANHEALSNLIRQIRAARPDIPGQVDPFGPGWRDEPLFTSKARLTPWVLDLLKRAAGGKLSRFSSVVVQNVGKRKLARIGGVWFDAALTAKSKVTLIRRRSAAARAIRSADPDIKAALALGRVVVLAADETRAFSLDDVGLSDPHSAELKALLTAVRR